MREHSAVAATALRDRDEHRPAPPQNPRSATLGHSIRGWGSLATRLLGAITLILVGVVHLQAYGGPYAAVPTIGTLFLVNFVAATTIGAALLVPLERITGRRWATFAVVLVSLAGVGLAGSSLVLLYVSEHGTVFGFHEPGYDPEAISRSRVSEFVTVGLLGLSLVLRIGPTTRPRW
jgi:hypothetical protein